MELDIEIYSWLTELDEIEAAEFVKDCNIVGLYQDLLFDLRGGERELMLYDVIVYVPLKIHKTLSQFTHSTSKIDEAIREYTASQDIHVRDIEWRPMIKSQVVEKDESEVNNEKRGVIISELINEEYVKKQISLMNQSIKIHPHLSLGLAKELIETCCKSILKRKNVSYDMGWDMLRLIKETNKVMELIPFDIENKETTISAIAKILAGFTNIVHGITELRNIYGTGHGHDPKFKMLDELYVRLAVSSAGEVGVFYLSLQKITERQQENISS